MKKYTKKQRFTLVEMMVAMGVFLILLTMLLNFFSGTRQVWRSLKGRNDVFEKGRIAMDLMTDLISGSVASKDMIPFHVLDGDKSCEFITRSNRALADSNAQSNGIGLYITRIYLNADDGRLYVKSEAAGASSADNFDKNSFGKPHLLATGTTGGKYIISSVGELKFTKLIEAQNSGNRPMAIEIKLTVFENEEYYKKWKDETNSAKKEELLAANGYTFSRVVAFDDIEEEL